MSHRESYRTQNFLAVKRRDHVDVYDHDGIKRISLDDDILAELEEILFQLDSNE